MGWCLLKRLYYTERQEDKALSEMKLDWSLQHGPHDTERQEDEVHQRHCQWNDDGLMVSKGVSGHRQTKGCLSSTKFSVE